MTDTGQRRDAAQPPATWSPPTGGSAQPTGGPTGGATGGATGGPSARPPAQPAASGAGTEPGAGFEWPFDSFGSAVDWWYRPIVQATTWTAFASLFVGALIAPLLFAAAVVIVAVTFSLSVVVVGIALIPPAFALIDALASVERRRAGWVGEPIAAPRFARGGGGFVSTISARLHDGARWRQVLFFALFLVVGPVLLALGALPWAGLLQFVFGTDFDPRSFDIGGFVLAALLAGGAPRITVLVARGGRAFTASLLGPSEAVELQERVTALSGQRQQILDAVADERRRIERNLHDGVQQQLVALGIDIGMARARLADDPDGARELLDSARDKVRGSIGELRLIGRGLHPAVLEDRGLDAALSAVVANSPIPIAVEVVTDVVLPEDVAATAYYVASESVANILKHAGARVGSIRLEDEPAATGTVRLTVHDDGCGGVDAARGSGLAGMRARVEGMDGSFDVLSPAGGPTTIVAVLPVGVAPRRQRPGGTNPP